MFASLPIVLPIFALILAGWLASKAGVLGPNASREINRLVVWLALPALLFDIMANASLEQIWEPRFILAFSAGCAVVFGFTLWLRRRQGQHLADAAIDGLNAAYANTGFLGFPLVLAVVGETGMGPTLIAAIITVCVLFGVAIVIIEFAVQSEARGLAIVTKTALQLARNPLLVSPVLGAIVMAMGWTIPAPIEEFLDLLGGAAAPCALIALGLFLAQPQAEGDAKDDRGGATTGLLVGLKLVVHPAVTWLVAGPLLGLPATVTQLAVLLAALPTGTGPFMLAEFYNRGAAMTGRVVLVSTIGSIATVSALLAISGMVG